MADSPDVTSVIEALAASYNWQGDSHVRASAVQFLEKLKAEDARKIAFVASSLVQQGRQDEVRLFGFQLLQHLVKNHWKDFNKEELQSLEQLSYKLFVEAATPSQPWALKSKAASILADVVKQEGPELWQQLLPNLLANGNATPVHAELAAVVLRFVAEDITVHNEDLEGKKRRDLLSALTASLSEVLPFIYELLNSHFSAAMAEASKGDISSAKLHAAVVTAGLSALAAFGEWAPVRDLLNLIDACGFLLQSTDFRIQACEFLKQMAARRKSTEEADIFDAAMARVFDSLSSASLALLSSLSKPGSSQSVDAELGFGEKLCEAFVALTPTNLNRAVAGSPERIAMFFQVAVGFYRSNSFPLHSQALTVLLSILRISAHLTESKGTPKKKKGAANESEEANVVALVLPVDVIVVLLDVAMEWIPRKTLDSEEDIDSDLSSGANFVAYRSKLFETVRLISSQHPLLSLSRIIPKVEAAVASTSSSPQINEQIVSQLDSAQLLAEAVIGAIPFSAIPEGDNDLKAKLFFLLEGLSQKLLALDWKNPILAGELSYFLHSLGPYFHQSPPSAALVVPKLFSLLENVSLDKLEALTRGGIAENKIHDSRLKVCLSVLRVSRSANTALVPYLQFMADQISRLREQRQLRLGELNQLGEALLVVSSAAGPHALRDATDWLLGPVKLLWCEPSWQHAAVADPLGFVRFLTSPDSRLSAESGTSVSLWWVYHSVMLFEKVATVHATGGEHPLGTHLVWILPPLVQILACLHSLWSPEFRAGLPLALQQAMEMSESEKSILLGDWTGRSSESSSRTEGEMEAVEGSGKLRAELHHWLKGVRDSGYNFIGLAASRASAAFFLHNAAAEASGKFQEAFLRHLASVESLHLRPLLRFVISPLLRHCPRATWHLWVDPQLRTLVPRLRLVLGEGWARKDGKAAVSSDTKRAVREEMVEDKLLRDLSREALSLLALTANLPPQPPAEPATNGSAAGRGTEEEEEGEAPRTLQGRETMLSYIVKNPEIAPAALQLGIEGMNFPDSESAHKALLFCSSVASLPALTQQPSGSFQQLLLFVSREMFLAGIQSLTLVSNGGFQAEVLGLLRDIYVKFSPISGAPREVLLSFLSINPEAVADLENSLSKSGSPKEQRQLLKNLLLQGTGTEQLKALLVNRGPVAVTNLSKPATNRGANAARLSDFEINSGQENVGLASLGGT